MRIVLTIFLALTIINAFSHGTQHCQKFTADGSQCLVCMQNFRLMKGRCHQKVQGCLQYNEQNLCQSCQAKLILIKNTCSRINLQKQFLHSTPQQNNLKKQIINARLLQTQNQQTLNSTNTVVINQKEQTYTIYTQPFPQQLLDLLNGGQSSQDQNQGSNASNGDQMIVQKGTTPPPSNLNRIIQTQLLPNWQVKQLAYVFRNRTFSNGSCLETFAYYIDLGNGTLVSCGTLPKTQMSNVCRTPNNFSTELIDPSFNTSGGKYSEDPQIANAAQSLLAFHPNIPFNYSIWLERDSFQINRYLLRYKRLTIRFDRSHRSVPPIANLTASMFYDTFFKRVVYSKIFQYGWDLSSTRSPQVQVQDHADSQQIKNSNNNQLQNQLQSVLDYVKSQKPQIINSTLEQYSGTKLQGGHQFHLYFVKHSGQSLVYQYTLTVQKKGADGSMKISVYEENMIKIDQDISQDQVVLQSSSATQDNGNLRSSN